MKSEVSTETFVKTSLDKKESGSSPSFLVLEIFGCSQILALMLWGLPYFLTVKLNAIMTEKNLTIHCRFPDEVLKTLTPQLQARIKYLEEVEFFADSLAYSTLEATDFEMATNFSMGLVAYLSHPSLQDEIKAAYHDSMLQSYSLFLWFLKSMQELREKINSSENPYADA